MFDFMRGLFRREGEIALEFAAVSERGLVRPDNQDHFTVHQESGVFCVADGMGGGEGGAKASEIACASISRAASDRGDFPERIKRIAAAVREANGEIRKYAKKAGFRQMATTVTFLAVERRTGVGVIGYVGDSRIYRFRDGELTQLTHDHTLAGELSRRAATRALANQLDGRAGALSHVLTRAVGIEPDVQTEWRKIDLRAGDMYLICSDGVYDMVAAGGLREAFAAGGTPQEVADRLAGRVVDGGAEDNYTAIVLRIGGHE